MATMSPRIKVKKGRQLVGWAGAGPVVNILTSSPANGEGGVGSGEGVGSPEELALWFTGEGSAIDDSLGDISSSIVWTSDVDGVLGTGASIGAGISGITGSSTVHTITATATDGTNVGSDQVVVTVLSPP